MLFTWSPWQCGNARTPVRSTHICHAHLPKRDNLRTIFRKPRRMLSWRNNYGFLMLFVNFPRQKKTSSCEESCWISWVSTSKIKPIKTYDNRRKPIKYHQNHCKPIKIKAIVSRGPPFSCEPRGAKASFSSPTSWHSGSLSQRLDPASMHSMNSRIDVGWSIYLQ